MSERVKKWTEGPWKGKEINLCDQELVGVSVAFLNTTHQGRYEEGVANMRLFRAAPGLVEALEDMIQAYTDLVNTGDCGGRWNPEHDEEVVNARAVLNMAYGKTQ